MSSHASLTLTVAMCATCRYYRIRTRVKACLKRKKAEPTTRADFQEYLEQALTSHTFSKVRPRCVRCGRGGVPAPSNNVVSVLLPQVAEFSSLVAWLVSLTWLRTGYNSSVYEYDSEAVPLDTFNLYIQCVP